MSCTRSLWALSFATTLYAEGVARADGVAAAPERKRVDLLLNDPRLGSREMAAPPGSFDEVRRGIESRFLPTRPMITEDAKPSVALRQLQNPMPPSGPTGRKLSPDPNVELQEAAEAAQRAYERPVRTRTVDIAITVDARGRILDEKVEQPSGNSHFDGLALEAAHAAFADSDLNTEGRAVIVRFRIRAGYGVTLPRAVPLIAPRHSNGRAPAGRPTIPMPFYGTFDETRGAAQVKPAFADKIDVDVKLLSVTPYLPSR